MCALLTKPDRRKIDLPARYIGFEIPDRFAIGYGLDYAERYRNLPYVAALLLDGSVDPLGNAEERSPHCSRRVPSVAESGQNAPSPLVALSDLSSSAVPRAREARP